jgi:hypothetical protein
VSTLDGEVRTCPRAACPATGPVVLASGQDTPFGLALDDRAVYWVNRGGGQVMMVAKP